MAVSASDVTKLYLAYFGRPPDFDGLVFYTSQPGATIQSVAANFSASPESQALYGASSLASVIDAIYLNLFNRHAEPAGITYWSTQIDSGAITPAFAAYAILLGAQNADKTAVQNKLQVATDWVAHLDTSAEITGYSGASAAASARAFLATVDSTTPSLTNAEAGLDAAIAAAIGASNNSALTATVSAPSVVEGNTGDAHQLAFVVSLNHAATAPVTLSYITTTGGTATAGSDYIATAGAVTFAAGETSKVVNVTVIGDILVEGNETVGLQVSGAAITNSGVTGTGTITDDDLAPQLTTAIDTINIAAAAGAATVRGVVDGANPQFSTFSVGDTIHGNGQTVVELDVATGGTGAFAYMDGVSAVNVVMGVASTINFNAIQWIGVGSVNLSNGANGGFVHITSLADGASLGLGATVAGHIAATYQDSEIVSLLNTGKGGASYNALNGDATVHLNTAGAHASIVLSSTAASVVGGDVVIDGAANSASATFVGVAPVGKDLTVGDVTISVGDSGINHITLAAQDIHVGAIGQAAGVSGAVTLAASASGDMVLGGIAQVAGTSGALSITIDGSGDITVGDISQADGSGTSAHATIDISDHAGGNITVGNVVQAAGNFVSMSVSESAAGTGDIHIGNVSQGVSNTGGSALMYVFGNSASGASVVGGNATIGNVSQTVGKSGYAMLSVTADGTGDIAIGNITQVGGAAATGYVNVFANLGGNVTVGNVDMTVGDGKAAQTHGVSITIETTGAAISVGNVSVVAGKEDFASISIDNNAGAAAGSVTVGNLSATVGDNIAGGFTPHAAIDVYNQGTKGGNTTVGNVAVHLGKTATGSVSVTQHAFNNKANGGNVTVGNVSLTLADKAHMSGSHDVFISNHATGFTSALHTGKNTLGNLTVGNVTAHMGTGAALTIDVTNSMSGANGGSVGNVSIGNVTVAADVHGVVNLTEFNYNDATGNVGNMSLGNVGVTLNDGGKFSMDVSNWASNGNAGNVTVGNVSVGLGVSGVLGAVDIDNYGNHAGNLTVGNIDIALGEKAAANTSFSISMTGTAGAGILTVGDMHVHAALSAHWEDMFIEVSSSKGDVGGVHLGNFSMTLDGATGPFAAATANTGLFVSALASSSGNVGSFAVGDVNINLGASASISNHPVWFDVDAGSIGAVTIGNEVVTLGVNAQVNGSDIGHFSASTGDIGAVSVGDVGYALSATAHMNAAILRTVSAASGTIDSVMVGNLSLVAATSAGFTVANVATASALLASTADLGVIVHAKGGIGDVTFGNLNVTGTTVTTTQALAVSVSNSGAGNIGDVTFGELSVAMTGAAFEGEIAVHVKSAGDIGDVTFGGFKAVGTSADIYAKVSAGGNIGNVDFGAATVTNTASVTAHVSATAGNVGSVNVGNVSVAGTSHVSFDVNANALTGNVTVGDVDVNGGVFALHFTGAQPTTATVVSMGTVTFNAPGAVTVDAGTANVSMAGITLVSTAGSTTGILGADDVLNLGATVGTLTVGTIKLEGTNAHNWNEFGTVVLPALTAIAGAGAVKVGTVDLSGFSASDSSAVLIDVSGLANAVVVKGSVGNDIITANAKGDTLWGDAGTDKFITQTQNQNITTTAAAATAKITTIMDFKAGPAFNEQVQVDAFTANTVGKYSEKTAADFNTAVTTALTQMNDPVLHSEVVAVQVGADTYLFVDQDGGHNIDEIVKLVGVTIGSLNYNDLIVV